ncbi:hypothetical protein K438DRAFT_2045896, partial [Mycena galopus ATCC 62051]
AESRKHTIDALPLPRDTPELGLGTWGVRRPRMASGCVSGERLRVIAGKVAKIQDAGLSDYELRAFNDEIKRLMGEKRDWENYIVALGGVN